MKKLFLPSALILVLGLGFALAQNITKSVQLSQDGTGTIGYDTSNNVYFPAHILNNALAGAPTASAPVGTAPTLRTGSSDFSGGWIGGAGNTSGTITFKTAYLQEPNCLVISQNPATSPIAYNAVATGINLTTLTGAVVVNYICSGAR